MKRLSVTFATLGFVVAITVASAQAALGSSFYVTDVTTSDANPDLARSVKNLVSSAVSSAGATLSADQSSADYALKTELIKLGGAYVLTVSKVRGNAVTFSSRQKAASADGLDDAADRAVRAAILSVSTKTDVRVGEIKPEEENTLHRRINSRSSMYLGFGPAGLVSMGESRLSYDLAIGHYWEVSPQAEIKVIGDIVSSGDMKTYFAMGQLGLDYFLTDGDSSPYVGAGLGFGGSASASSSATTIGGLAANAGLGYQFFRTASTHFDVFAGYFTIFGNNTIGAPGAYSLRIGVLF